MPELICHLLGDYVFQNHWMATNKVRAWVPAIIHASIYSSPFLLLRPSWQAMAVIFGTHLIIDRFRLAGYWVRFFGIGCESWFQRNYPTTPISPDAPPFLSVWLLIIVDNTFHLAINHAAIKCL